MTVICIGNDRFAGKTSLRKYIFICVLHIVFVKEFFSKTQEIIFIRMYIVKKKFFIIVLIRTYNIFKILITFRIDLLKNILLIHIFDVYCRIKQILILFAHIITVEICRYLLDMSVICFLY